jgi:putative ABC transport system permease protein
VPAFAIVMTSAAALASRLLAALRLATRNLLRHRRRTLIAVSSVAFGIAALVVARGFTEWMFFDFREATIESQYAHVQVTRPGFHEDGASDPFRYLLPPAAGATAAEGVPHLRSLAPRLALTGLISRGEATVSFTGEGIDPAKDLTDDRSLRILQGSKLQSTDSSEVLLGRGLGVLLGANVGDNVVLLVNTPRGGINAVDARVAGIFSSVSKAYDDSALLVSIGTARRLLKVQGAHTLLMYLDDTRHTDAVAAGLRARLDPKAFEVRTWDQLADFYTRAVALLREQLGVVRLIVVAIILLGIGNTMMMSVVERTGEIGTTMALGVRRRAVLGQFLAEGALIGAVGGVAGLALALLVGGGIGALGIEMPPPPGLTRGYIARVLFTTPIILEAPILAIATTMLASLYPAWKASRMVIVDAIRYNR